MLFASKWGGNTKYVSLANDIIKSMPQNETYDELQSETIKNKERIKTGLWKTYANLAAICLIIVAVVFMNYHSLHGTDMKEIYCKRYLCREQEVAILYQQSYGNYELAVLCDDKNIAYGLYEKTVTNTGNDYELYYLYKVPVKKLISNYSVNSVDVWTETEDIKLDFMARQEIWELMKGFYQKIYKKGIFDETTSYCVGISFNEYVKDIKINNQAVDTQETVVINENQAFIWSVRDINLETVDFFDMQQQNK
ncbi:MAG: hypothetical protein HDR00_10785 [Lachnospiraceae bacterium]|nr:hypothetical protein [Lachnospiraceae bacterium]